MESRGNKEKCNVEYKQYLIFNNYLFIYLYILLDGKKERCHKNQSQDIWRWY